MRITELETLLATLTSLTPDERRNMVIAHVRQQVDRNPQSGVRLTPLAAQALAGLPDQMTLPTAEPVAEAVEA